MKQGNIIICKKEMKFIDHRVIEVGTKIIINHLSDDRNIALISDFFNEKYMTTIECLEDYFYSQEEVRFKKLDSL